MNSSDSLSSKENFLENIIHRDLESGFNKENLKFRFHQNLMGICI